jgi:hypothetical protein
MNIIIVTVEVCSLQWKLKHSLIILGSKILLLNTAIRSVLFIYLEQIIIAVIFPVTFLQFLQIECATLNFSIEKCNYQQVKLTFVHGIWYGVVCCGVLWSGVVCVVFKVGGLVHVWHYTSA